MSGQFRYSDEFKIDAVAQVTGRALRQGCKIRYTFIDAHRRQHPVRVLCKMLSVHPKGFPAWVKEPLSLRAVAR